MNIPILWKTPPKKDNVVNFEPNRLISYFLLLCYWPRKWLLFYCFPKNVKIKLILTLLNKTLVFWIDFSAINKYWVFSALCIFVFSSLNSTGSIKSVGDCITSSTSTDSSPKGLIISRIIERLNTSDKVKQSSADNAGSPEKQPTSSLNSNRSSRNDARLQKSLDLANVTFRDSRKKQSSRMLQVRKWFQCKKKTCLRNTFCLQICFLFQ